MSKIIVLSDSGIGKTSWLFAMTGRKPLDVYRSTASEQFWFTQTTPAVPFLGVHAQVNDSKLSKLSAGADGVVVLYNDKSNPLHWLNPPGYRTRKCPQMIDVGDDFQH